MAAEEDFKGLSELAEKLGLEDAEREGFISSSMKRLGHKMRTVWEDGDGGDSGGDGGDFFSSKRREKRTPEGGGQSRRASGDSGAGWPY